MKNTFSLKNNRDFVLLYKKGKFASGKYLVLYVLPSKNCTNRLGVTVSKKIGNSVKRNRVKRLIRENFILIEQCLLDWHDFVFVARKSEELPDFYVVKKEMKFLLKRLGLIDLEKVV